MRNMRHKDVKEEVYSSREGKFSSKIKKKYKLKSGVLEGSNFSLFWKFMKNLEILIKMFFFHKKISDLNLYKLYDIKLLLKLFQALFLNIYTQKRDNKNNESSFIDNFIIYYIHSMNKLNNRERRELLPFIWKKNSRKGWSQQKKRKKKKSFAWKTRWLVEKRQQQNWEQ